MPISFDYTGPTGNAVAAMLAAKIAGEDAAAAALLAASQPEVPVDSGELVASGHVEPSKGAGASVVYTATNPEDGYDYAAIQHQRTDFKHEQGKDHYLSDPMDQAHAEMEPALFAPVRKLLS